MAVREILIAPDPRLKVKAENVEAVDADVRALMDDMLETMYDANGIGLAAPQIGVAKRVIVIDLADHKDGPKPIRIANPEIIWSSDEENEHEEGCLSLPDQWAKVVRPERVRIRYLDQENEIRELEAEGLLATCIQHEMDHLEGVLFVDHVSNLKRNMILKRLQKLKKQQATA